MLSRLDLVLLFLIVYDMTVSPDSETPAPSSGRSLPRRSPSEIIYWRYRVALAHGGPPRDSDRLALEPDEQGAAGDTIAG